MAKQFEYRICQVQQSYVTWVNGKWQGKTSPALERAEAAVRTCPEVWEYLRQAGAEGWELASALASGGDDAGCQLLYLKRARE